MTKQVEQGVPGAPEAGEAWAGGAVQLTVPVAVDWTRIGGTVLVVAMTAVLCFVLALAVQVAVSMPDVGAAEGISMLSGPLLLQGVGMVLVITGVVSIPYVAVNVVGSSLRVKADAKALELGQDAIPCAEIASITWRGPCLLITRKDGSAIESETLKPVNASRLLAVLTKATGVS